MCGEAGRLNPAALQSHCARLPGHDNRQTDVPAPVTCEAGGGTVP